ncbi:hypothetical protein HAX54_023060 [Datura stramonium]|uniref:Uncharacterized protein n=1 Tax=Datura stramonium TaxID=4076 RepID=A0ABS8UY03_DATST|nr:hypothetical protein [Datura stramonium]
MCYCLQDYDSFEKFTINDYRVSHLFHACYQDMMVRVYTRKPELVKAVSEAFENFQMKTYGKKSKYMQLLEKETPELLPAINDYISASSQMYLLCIHMNHRFSFSHRIDVKTMAMAKPDIIWLIL